LVSSDDDDDDDDDDIIVNTIPENVQRSMEKIARLVEMGFQQAAVCIILFH